MWWAVQISAHFAFTASRLRSSVTVEIPVLA